MRGVRTAVSVLLDAVGIIDLVLAARRYTARQPLPILTYHRLGVAHHLAAQLDETVVDATPEGFARQLAFLTKKFTLVGITELRAHFIDGQPLPRNAAVITFDDGYRECYELALPALQRAGAKAVFFIATDPIENRTPFWWDRASYLVKHAAKTHATLDYPRRIELDLMRDRPLLLEEIINVIKETPGLDVDGYLDALGSALEVEWGASEERRIATETLMTWEEIRALHRGGMDVQSHTRSHRVLQTLAPHELDDELTGSRRILEHQLGAPVTAIAYPVSLIADRDETIFNAVRRAGYDLGFSTSRGRTPLAVNSNPINLQRIWMDPAVAQSYFRGILAMPAIAHRRR